MPKTARLLLPVAAGLLFACANSSSEADPVRCDEGTTLVDGACKPTCGDEVCAEDQVCDPLAERCAVAVEPKCGTGTSWSAGVPAFREATADWGLTGVEGQRLSVADLDGDGWADLSVRKAGLVVDDFAAGARANWLLRNDGGRFVDITEASGWVVRRDLAYPGGRPAEVVAFADVDNDGDVDALTAFSNTKSTSGARDPEGSELLLNDGSGNFTLGPAEAAFRRARQLVARAGVSFTDYDRDGLVDVWMANGNLAQDQLYRNTGGGMFVEVTEQAGLVTVPWGQLEPMNEGRASSTSWSSAACDLDGDGATELLSSAYGRAPNHLWKGVRGNGGTTFVNRSVASGYAFDERRDWSDNESARCFCKLHPDAENCEGVPAPQVVCNSDDDILRWNHDTDREPFRLGGNSGTTVCADVDNDGAIDLLTSEIVHWDVGSSSDPSELLFNTGEAELRFERPGNDVTGLTRVHEPGWNDGDMTAAVFDFDNDGRPDVYVGSSDYPGTRGLLYRQREAARTFEAVPVELGIDHKASHGIAVADFDRDGDLDVVVGHSRSRCVDQCYETANVRLFENVLGQDGNWVQLKLEGTEANRSAIGARVTVKAGDVVQTQEVGGGHGHYGIQHDLALHFGLGSACEAEVTVRWPDGQLTEQRFTVQSGHRFHVVQGEMPAPL